MAKVVLAIDQGTTGTTALVLDRRLAVKGKANVEFRQIFPKPGQVEHDLEDIWTSTQKAIAGALREAGVKGADLEAIGITNQRETTLLWERRAGRPLYHAIVWQDRRTAGACDELRKQGKEPWIREKTGLVLDAYFSGTKLQWLLENVKGARERAERGELAFGTVDSALLWKLTGGAVHATDVTNASRTLLMNLTTRAWDDELLALFGVPRQVLPEIRPSAGEFGRTKGVRGLPDGIPIAGIAGDQQAAMVGQACFAEGEAKCTYGTGAFLLMNAGPKPVTSKHGLLGTVAWQIGDEVAYALEGSAFVAGAVVQWLRDGLGIIRQSSEIEALAKEVPDSGGVVFVPALAGLGAPHWRQDARGLVCGIDRGVTKAHLARAALEGIAFEIYELAQSMAQDIGKPMPMFRVDGGASTNDLLMQFQADLLQTPIERPRMVETTALGAAFLAGIGTGMWAGTKEVAKAWKPGRRFLPKMKDEAREAHLARWRKAIARVCA
ncbi:MAG: glycerol kinase GlpK [Deltaproteobacteria bacterium]|nr:MAG: glycerol kinase GlpK [Deltaproteobacteria bacterium]TMB36915.1 MAG: glycerol kinase GlpK [Deltaproteobacteria bacterium]